VATAAQLRGDEIQVWLVDPDTVGSAGQVERYLGLLTADERSVHQGYLFERHRHRYLVRRALLRTVLSRYADVAPEDWRFDLNAYGRPEVSGPTGARFVRFNLSHTDGLIACAVTRRCDLGVDVEDVTRTVDPMLIARTHFSAGERADLGAISEAGQRGRFFEYWTLKEAYIKARGMGLSIPLDQFGFWFGEDQRIGIRFDPRLGDDRPADWQFELFRPTPRHLMAVGIRREKQANVPVTILELEP